MADEGPSEGDISTLRTIFPGSREGALLGLLASATRQTLKGKTRIATTGEPATHLHVLAEGVVRIFHNDASEGLEVTVKHLRAPCTFTEKEVLAKEPVIECTETLVDSILLKIDAQAFLRFLAEDPAATRCVLDDVCRRFCVAIRNELSLLRPVPARLASLLLALAELFGDAGPSGVRIRLPLTQQDLADDLGVGLRSVSRTLSVWSEKGWVARKKGWFFVSDLEQLRSLCQGLERNLNYDHWADRPRRQSRC